MFILPSHAKINLHLRVLRVRGDGYHEIATLLHAIDLSDEMTFSRTDSGVHLQVSGLPVEGGRDNLAHRAATLLMRNHKASGGVRISLIKRIPVAAGLGGGSSNAAVTLTALNRLWDFHLSRERLHELAATLGSDVPFFLSGAAALGRGRGEILSPLPALKGLYLVLVVPPFQVTSARAYGDLNLELTKSNDDISMMQSITSAEKIKDWAPLLRNDLEAPVIGRHPEIEQIKAELMRSGAQAALMSGSGPTVFGLYIQRDVAGRATKALSGKGWEVILSRTITEFESSQNLSAPRE